MVDMCKTEENWLNVVRHDDKQAIAWFRLMLQESEERKKYQEDARFLGCLERAGVDNWELFDVAVDMFKKEQ